MVSVCGGGGTHTNTHTQTHTHTYTLHIKLGPMGRNAERSTKATETDLVFYP
jgi:hypothetical protein